MADLSETIETFISNLMYIAHFHIIDPDKINNWIYVLKSRIYELTHFNITYQRYVDICDEQISIKQSMPNHYKFDEFVDSVIYLRTKGFVTSYPCIIENNRRGTASSYVTTVSHNGTSLTELYESALKIN